MTAEERLDRIEKVLVSLFHALPLSMRRLLPDSVVIALASMINEKAGINLK